jgi:pSer/pThr/pTyr-binding forkhead associated (FHA) protein
MGARVQFLSSDRRGRIVELGPDPLSVGRQSDCDIRLDDPSVRRRHAEIFSKDGRYWIRALKGEELLVGGQFVSEHELDHRDKVSCGTVVLEYFED